MLFARQKAAKALPATRTFAVNEKAVKNRMKSVQSIVKITRAMKLVAASKMNKDVARLLNGKNFGHGSIDTVFKSDTYMQRKAPQESTAPRELLVPLTTDRGLCGGINSNIVREVKQYVAQGNRANIKIFAIGEKGPSALVRPFPDLLSEAVSELALPINYSTIMAVASKIDQFSLNEDRIIIFYNEFKTMITYVIRKMELMPRKRFIETIKY